MVIFIGCINEDRDIGLKFFSDIFLCLRLYLCFFIWFLMFCVFVCICVIWWRMSGSLLSFCRYVCFMVFVNINNVNLEL